MPRLESQYHKTQDEPNPPVLHFALPIKRKDIYTLAKEYDYFRSHKDIGCLTSPEAQGVIDVLSGVIGHPITIVMPSPPTRGDCDVVLSFLTNYSLENGKFNGKHFDEENEQLGNLPFLRRIFHLEPTVQRQWYFDYNGGRAESEGESEDED